MPGSGRSPTRRAVPRRPAIVGRLPCGRRRRRRRREYAEQWVRGTGLGERHGDVADRLGEGPINRAPRGVRRGCRCRSNAEEPEVRVDHPVGEVAEFRLDAPLGRGLLGLGIADVEGPAAQDDPGPCVEFDTPQRLALKPDRDATGRAVEARVAQHRGVLTVGGLVLGPGAQEQERLHSGKDRASCSHAA